MLVKALENLSLCWAVVSEQLTAAQLLEAAEYPLCISVKR